MCCLLLVFVSNQLPCLHTNSLHGPLLPRMNLKSLWWAKGLDLGEHSGGGCNGMSLVSSKTVQQTMKTIKLSFQAPEVTYAECELYNLQNQTAWNALEASKPLLWNNKPLQKGRN